MKLNIAVDFDGCITKTVAYPKVGEIRPEAKDALRKIYDMGHTIIINSCRAKDYELDACQSLVEAEVPFHYFNENNPELISKYGMDPRKISADLNYDDKNVGGLVTWDKFLKAVEYEARPTIICIVGKSGSGKTLLAEYFESRYGIKMIESYTTRPKRTPDEKGHTFVDNRTFDQFSRKDMIAFTEFGDYRYCCLKSDVEKVCTYVIDERGLEYLRENFSDEYNIVSIMRARETKQRVKSVGKERVNRDIGKFFLMPEDFDFISVSHPTIEEVYKDADDIIDRILIRKVNSVGESLIF